MKLTNVRQVADSSISGKWVGAKIEFTVGGKKNMLVLSDKMNLDELEIALKSLITQLRN